MVHSDIDHRTGVMTAVFLAVGLVLEIWIPWNRVSVSLVSVELMKCNQKVYSLSFLLASAGCGKYSELNYY